MKKRICVALLLLCAAAALIAPQFSLDAGASYIVEEDDAIKVFIGSTNGYSESATSAYYIEQSELMDDFENSTATYKALVTFSDFVDDEYADNILGSASQIDKVYIWTPNETGRAIIKVFNNDIPDSIQDYFENIDVDSIDDQNLVSILSELPDNYGVFAVEVEATHEVLSSLELADNVQVDIIQSPSAMQRANDSGKEIQYICVPEKPDGTT